jgi:GAG-pre-integrase domain
MEDLVYTLISVDKLAYKGITSIFWAETMEVKIEPKTLILGKGIRDHEDPSLYVLPSPKQYEHTLASVNNKNDFGTWHKRMAHMNLHDLRQAQKYSEIPNFSDVVDDGACSPCREGKATKLPFRDNFEHAGKVGEIIQSDMAGKLPVSFPDRYQYITRPLRYGYLYAMSILSILGYPFGPISAAIRTDVVAASSKRFSGVYRAKAARCKFWRALASRCSCFVKGECKT